MLSGGALDERFEKRLRSRPVAYAAEICEEGLVLGAGTTLARMTRDAFGAPQLAVEEDEDRVLALLAAAHGRTASPELRRHLEGASAYWRRGEKALANIRLAFAAIPRLEDRADAYRLFLAEELLDGGMSPGALMKGLGFEPPHRGFLKYDPNQPRIPAGNGRSSGRWGTGSGAPPDSVSARGVPPATAQALRGTQALRATRDVGTLAQGLFDAVASSEFLTGLGALAESFVGPSLVLGGIFIPTPAGRVSEGAIPGQPGLHYSFDEPAGVLRLYSDDERGRQTVAYASRDAHGIFADSDTSTPIARFLNGSLVFNADSLADDTPDQASQRTNDEPRLCPDPGPDVPHGASERARAYQALISELNNPQRPLPPGMAVSLLNPETGKRVVFDDCRESDGTMIEAKGPGYSQMLNYEFLATRVRETWLSQADRQLAAARSRDVEWFFAEPEAREKAREWFGAEEKYQKIELSLVPAEAPR